MRLQSWEDNGLTYWPLYVQLSYRRKTTQIKSRFISNNNFSVYMTENEYNKYANGENADILLYNEKTDTPLMHWTINSKADIFDKKHRLTAELNAYKIGIPIVEEWQNKEFSAFDTGFSDCLAVFKEDYKKILLSAAVKLDYEKLKKQEKNGYKRALLHLITGGLLPKVDYMQMTAIFQKNDIDLQKAFATKDIEHFKAVSQLISTNKKFLTFADWFATEFVKYKEDTQINEVVKYIKTTCKEIPLWILDPEE